MLKPWIMFILRGGWSYGSTVSSKSRSPPVGRRLLLGGFSMEKTSRAVTHLPIKIQWDSDIYSCQALIDSAAEGNFLDFSLASKLKVPVSVLKNPISVVALSGQSLSLLTHTTGLIRLVTSGNQTEDIQFFMSNFTYVPVVLGLPWLALHNPHIKDEHGDLSNVPSEYLDLKGVFSKSRAASLPPHRPYDCAMDLLPGTSPPKGRLYSLSAPEREAMVKYISNSLAAKIIRPSSSPAGVGFFFCGLNSITVKNTYPLPLMSSAFDRLQGALFFMKLDLRNVYHLVRMREGDDRMTGLSPALFLGSQDAT